MSAEGNELYEHIKTERKFIHDLASPLMIAMGMVDSVNGKIEDENLKQRLGKASNALPKMNDILKNRRSGLIEIMENMETD